MQLTEEQLKIIGDAYFDDLPIRYEDVDQAKFWNNMPHLIQCEALKWGGNDTEVRGEIHELILRTHLGVTIDQWYDKDDSGVYTHELAEALFGKDNEPIYIELEYDKLKDK